ncbi:MAG: SpoIIE family protein phosphatase [Hahellaceae bacterium]|nr:SpoIIE family protein phosphatase [Hahellaceae bacterium]
MKVLVVDDDNYSRKLITYVLEEAGHSVCVAEDGQKGVDAWTREQPDLVLMDLMMPVMDGYESATRIKEEAGQLFVPIVFMTAMSEDKAMVRCLEVGDDFLLKPVNLVMLQAKIRVHERNLELNRQVFEQNKELAYFRAKVSAEFDMTQQIMKVALQNNRPFVDGVKVHCSPHSTFNGDLVLVHEKRDGGLYILVGDFTGHGLASSIGSVPVSQAFSTLAERNSAVGVMAREFNRILYRFLPRTMFFAMTLLELNASRTLLEVWAGGLPDAFIVSPDGTLKRRLGSNHMPVGALEHHEFEAFVEKVELTEGDKILIYTDGVNEATNPDGELFGEERLLKVICSPEPDLIGRTLTAVKEFMQAETFQDDLSMLVVHCKETSRKVEAIKKEAVSGESGTAVEQGRVAQEFSLPAFHAEFHWSPDQLREPDPLQLVRSWLEHHVAIRAQKEIVLSVLSEVFNNSLDHGLLSMDSKAKEGPDGFDTYYRERERRLKTLASGFITLEVGYENKHPCEILLVVRDSGRGFNYHDIDLDDSESTFGRGLPVIKALCSEMRFEDEGATIRLRIPLS